MIPKINNLKELECTHHISQGYTVNTIQIHDVYEIYMTCIENIRFFVNGCVYTPAPGDVMLLTNTDLYKVIVPSNVRYEHYIIAFSPEVIRALPGAGPRLLDCFSSMHHLSLPTARKKRFIELFETIAARDPHDELMQVGRWLALSELLFLLCLETKCNPDSLPAPERAFHPQVCRVIDFIDCNFTRSFSLDELSAMCFLNKSYLCRLFRRETGFSIGDYTAYRRLSNAIVLLRDGASVGDAARLSGFGSDTFFITTFRRNVGTTPYQYARAHRSANIGADW